VRTQNGVSGEGTEENNCTYNVIISWGWGNKNNEKLNYL
jgi:hypothetical protein